jgi:hypothetical protein
MDPHGVRVQLGRVSFFFHHSYLPGEWLDAHVARGLGSQISLGDLIFDLPVNQTTRRRPLPFSSTLVLPGLNVYEGLGIDDPEKAKWHDFVFRAPGRDLKGAVFDFAGLPRVDFTGAQLQGASFFGAQLQGASLAYAQLQGAILDDAQLEGAQLDRAQLQGAQLYRTQLQGSSLDYAGLQGASLTNARLEGASLVGAQLQGASLQQANLQATDLSDAFLWRSNAAPFTTDGVAKITDVRLTDWPDQWRPVWRSYAAEDQPSNDPKLEPWGEIQKTWNAEAYQDLRGMMKAIPVGELRDQALESVGTLDCAISSPILASCDPNQPPPSAAAEWRGTVEHARVDDSAYFKALSSRLGTLVCSGGNNTDDILRGLSRTSVGVPLLRSRLEATGPEESALTDTIKRCLSPAR